MKSPKIIAEIGCNHKGDMAIAKEMIMTAATYCKVDVVKFQKRCNKELLTPEEYNAPHPHPEALALLLPRLLHIFYRKLFPLPRSDYMQKYALGKVPLPAPVYASSFPPSAPELPRSGLH